MYILSIHIHTNIYIYIYIYDLSISLYVYPQCMITKVCDYQARRGNIKYKQAGNKPTYVHTLNASGLATSRIMPAMLEQHQNEDGSVTIPRVLHCFTGFDTISPI